MKKRELRIANKINMKLFQLMDRWMKGAKTSVKKESKLPYFVVSVH